MNDGGPVFPQPEKYRWQEHREDGGISLRDFFAALAMHGDMVTRDPKAGYEYRDVAITAYWIADAMLEAREVKNE